MITRFLTISDTHFGSTATYSYRGFTPIATFSALLQEMQRRSPASVSAVLHLGDISGDAAIHADASHYPFAQTMLDQLSAPVLSIAGNHDQSALVRRVLPTNADIQFRSAADDRLDYTVVIGHVRILALDSSQFTRRLGVLISEQYEWLRGQLRASQEPCVIMVHHPVHPIGCAWIDETMLLKEGQELHQLLREFRSSVVAVLHGHIHDPMVSTHDGIPYIGVPSALFSFNTQSQAPDGSISVTPAGGYAELVIDGRTAQVSFRTVYRSA